MNVLYCLVLIVKQTYITHLLVSQPLWLVLLRPVPASSVGQHDTPVYWGVWHEGSHPDQRSKSTGVGKTEQNWSTFHTRSGEFCVFSPIPTSRVFMLYYVCVYHHYTCNF